MKIIDKILNNNYILLFILFCSFFLLTSSLTPYIEAKNNNIQVQKEYSELQSKYSDLQNMSNITEKGGEMQQKFAREEYQISNSDELLFVFPE